MSKSKEWIVALSLANLYLMGEWITLVSAPRDGYFSDTVSVRSYVSIFLALVICTLINRALLFVGRTSTNRMLSAASYFLLMLILLAPVMVLRRYSGVSVKYPQLSFTYMLGNWGLVGNYIKIGLILTGAFVVFERIQRHLFSPVFNAVAAMSLATIVTFGRVTEQFIADATFVHNNLSPQAASASKVIWMVFDEMDEHFSTEGRPAGFALPNFDRFRNETFTASQAYSPARWTLVSMPSFITGHLLSSVVPLDRSELELTMCRGSKKYKWTEVKGIFAKAKALGRKNAVVGWDHPYCRIKGKNLDFCLSLPETRQSYHSTLASAVSSVLLRPFLKPVSMVEIHTERYDTILNTAEDVIGRPDLNFVFLHWPVPHSPGILQGDKKVFQFPQDSHVEGYFNNLHLADQAFGKIRAKLEATGEWENSTILVTSDHAWRFIPEKGIIPWDPRKVVSRRVPFMVKLPGKQQKAFRYNTAFNNVVLHQLLLSLIKGEVRTNEQIAEALEKYSAPLYSHMEEGTPGPVWPCDDPGDTDPDIH